jgi:hypothetical protein
VISKEERYRKSRNLKQPVEKETVMHAHLMTVVIVTVVLLAHQRVVLAAPLEVGEATGNPITLNKNVKEGDFVLLDKGDPTNATDQANKDLWSDVLRFMRINVGAANETVTVRLISDADPADLSDTGFANVTLQANKGFGVEPQPGKPGQPVPLFLYTPDPGQPGYEGGTVRQYQIVSDPSEFPITEPATFALLGLAFAGMGLARRRKLN